MNEIQCDNFRWTFVGNCVSCGHGPFCFDFHSYLSLTIHKTDYAFSLYGRLTLGRIFACSTYHRCVHVQEDANHWALESASEFDLVRLLDRLLNANIQASVSHIVKRGCVLLYDVRALQWWLTRVSTLAQRRCRRLPVGCTTKDSFCHLLLWFPHG